MKIMLSVITRYKISIILGLLILILINCFNIEISSNIYSLFFFVAIIGIVICELIKHFFIKKYGYWTKNWNEQHGIDVDVKITKRAGSRTDSTNL